MDGKSVQVFRIGTKFNGNVVVPTEAIDKRFWESVSESGRRGVTVDSILRGGVFLTADGKYASIRFIGTFREQCAVEIEECCRMVYGMGFGFVKSVWDSRFFKREGFWHHIEMKEVSVNDRVKGLSA